MRLLYHPTCNRMFNGDMSLIDFTKANTTKIIILIPGMLPGLDYPRQTVEEAMLWKLRSEEDDVQLQLRLSI